MSHDFAAEDDQDAILEPAGATGFTPSPGDGAPLASELLSIHPIQPLDGGSTALRAGPRPGAQRLWVGDTEVTDLSRKRSMSTRWWLVIAVAIILAATLAALYGLAWGPIEGAQSPEVSSSPAPPSPVHQAGRSAARVTLPPLAVSVAAREVPRVLPPPSETRDSAARPRISAWLPQRKPAPSQAALLTDGGNGVFVQLGSVKSAVGAKREWDRLVGEFPGVLNRDKC